MYVLCWTQVLVGSDAWTARVGRGFSDCERDFSGAAGYVIQEQRSKLNPSTVDDVLFLHSNLKHHAKQQIVNFRLEVEEPETSENQTKSFDDDIMNERLRQVLQRLWSFHMNRKLQFNLEFREPSQGSSQIPSPRINTRVSTSAVSDCKFASSRVGGRVGLVL